MMLVIFGPTATGKTDLAIRLAKKYNGELISADSRQIYKTLDIATGKVSFHSKVEKHHGFWIVDGVKIHGFDLVDPGQEFTVFDFLKFVSTTLFRINEVKKLPIVVGGTGFYIKGLIDGIQSIGILKNQKLRARLEKLSAQDLYQKLFESAPTRAKLMNESDRQNPRRLIRAIEIAVSPKKKTSTNYHLPTIDHLLIGLTAPNKYLFKRVDNWIDERFKHGMIEEVQNLLKSRIDAQWLDSIGLYYRWLTKIALGQMTKEEAVIRLTADGHNFVRRQKAWFGKLRDIALYDISQPSWPQKLEKTIKDWYDKQNAGITSTN